MRPRSIDLFAAAYLVHGVVMLVHGYLMRDRQSLAAVELLGDLALPTILALRAALVLLLAWAICFRASRIARWLVVILIAGMLIRLPQAWGGIAEGNIRAIVWALGFLSGVTAVAWLFAPASRIWLATEGGSPVDPAVFE